VNRNEKELLLDCERVVERAPSAAATAEDEA
jgi:hypothetical protein